MLITVRPIDIPRWHKKVGEESFTRPKKIQALVDSATMMYATGLNYEKGPNDEPSEADKLSKDINQDLSATYNPDTPHPFWDSSLGVIKLENNTMIFNLDNTIDIIKVKIMKASRYVANSQKEYEEGLFPEATHVIYDETEDKEVKASKVALKNKAIIDCAKLSKGKKIQVIMILDNKNLKGQSDDFITVAIDELIAKDPGEVIRYISMDAEEVSNHALVLEALQKNVLRKEGHKILYYDSLLGLDVMDVVIYLSEPDNQELKIRLMAAVNE